MIRLTCTISAFLCISAPALSAEKIAAKAAPPSVKGVAIAKSPTYEQLMREGDSLCHHGRFIDAQLKYLDAEKHKPGDVTAKAKLAEILPSMRKEQRIVELIDQCRLYMEQGETEKARGFLNRAEAIDPHYAETQVRFAESYLLDNDYSKALAAASKAVTLAPDYDRSYYRRACVYAGLKKYDLAKKDFLKTIELKPTAWLAYFRVGEIDMALGKYQLAVDEFHQFVKVTSEHRHDREFTLTYMNTAQCYRKLNLPAKEREEYTALLRYEPENVDCFRMRGDSFAREKMYAKAAADYKEAIDLEPENEHCLTALKKMKDLMGH